MSELEPPSPGEENDAPAGPPEAPAERPVAIRWDPTAVFREIFLCHFDRPRDAVALRRIGQLLYGAVLEVSSNRTGANNSIARAQLRGALADLRHLQGCCESLVQYDREMRLAPGEHRLCHFAGELAAGLGELAATLAQKLAGPPARRT